MEPRQRRHGQGYAGACCGRLHASVPSSMLAVVCLDITMSGSPTRRLAWLMELPHRTFKDGAAACGGDVFARHREPGSRLHQGACRSSLYAEKPSPPFLLAGRSACPSLSCRESWRGAATPSGFGRNRPAQTISPPPRAASSRDKLCVPPGPSRCYGRWRGAARPPPPTGSQQGRTGATLNS